jgi:hypothetical protein
MDEEAPPSKLELQPSWQMGHNDDFKEKEVRTGGVLLQ